MHELTYYFSKGDRCLIHQGKRVQFCHSLVRLGRLEEVFEQRVAEQARSFDEAAPFTQVKGAWERGVRPKSLTNRMGFVSNQQETVA